MARAYCRWSGYSECRRPRGFEVKPGMERKSVLLCAVAALACTAGISNAQAQAPAPAPAPRLIVVGKTVNYRQSAAGDLAKLNYHFFAEIFLEHGGTGSGRLTDPHGRVRRFDALTDLLSISGKTDFASLEELNAQAPDGAYRIQFEGPQAPSIEGTLKVRATPSALADPVHLQLLQNGVPVGADGVDVSRELTVVWSPFRKGRADPNKISDDLIFVHLGDCQGKIIARTPAPFSDSPALTFRTASYSIPANTLQPGATYQLSVEHAPVLTRRMGGVPALVTYPATTFLDLRTAGSRGACPEVPYRMDNGQSDRHSAPTSAPAAQASADVRFFVVVKSSNYSQDAAGGLKLLNYHFFSEIFPAAVPVSGELNSGLWPKARPYQPHDQTLYVEGGHFNTLAALDSAYPNGSYRVSLRGPHVTVQ